MKNSKDKGKLRVRWLEATKRNDTSILKFENQIRFHHFFILVQQSYIKNIRRKVGDK